MKTRFCAILVACISLILLSLAGIFWAQKTIASAESVDSLVGTAITYQGYLIDNGTAADGVYDLNFDLYDDEFTTGTPIGTVQLDDIGIESGVFTVQLDFGEEAFDGDERWLEIGVRHSGDTGDFALLAGRQPITPTPYALFAVEAGEVDWLDIISRPDGLDDGDDDTQYDPGFGLSVEGYTFNVITDTVQARISGNCQVGSTIRDVNPDGSITCEPHVTRPVFSQTTLATSTDSYSFSMITIGSDGLPIISFRSESQLKVAHCKDLACTSADISSLDIGVHNFGAITIGADGLPILTYVDYSTAEHPIYVAHCENLACSSASIVNIALNEGAQNGMVPITIGSDGLPFLCYWDNPFGFFAVHCDDIYCTSATQTYVDYFDGSSGRLWISIAIGTDGFPIIAYYDFDEDQWIGDLKVAHCDDVACSSFSINLVDTGGIVGKYASIAIGWDGLPIIGYQDYTNGDLKVAHCDDIACAGSSLQVLDSADDVGGNTSITIGSDGLPMISYYDQTNGNLKVAHCDDITCTHATLYPLDTASMGDAHFTSISVGIDGFPILTFYNYDSNQIRITHCSTPSCVPYWSRR